MTDKEWENMFDKYFKNSSKDCWEDGNNNILVMFDYDTLGACIEQLLLQENYKKEPNRC